MTEFEYPEDGLRALRNSVFPTVEAEPEAEQTDPKTAQFVRQLFGRPE
jgi:hypothetical protein